MHDNLIRTILLIIPLDEDGRDFVRKAFHVKSYPKDSYFLEEGQVCREVEYIEKGLAIVGIGIEFYVIPETAVENFGISVRTQGNHAFQHIKGIRDFFTGLLIITLFASREYRALGLASFCGAIIPTADFIIVLTQPYYAVGKLIPHLVAIVICIILGIGYLRKVKLEHKQ